MDCCDKFMKFILIFFNLILFIFSIALIIFGAILLTNTSDFREVLNEVGGGLSIPQITLILVGCVILVTTFFGCCGAIKNNRCMIITYAVILLVMFILELTVGAYTIYNNTNIEGAVNKTVEKVFMEQGVSTNSTQRKIFGGIERALQCCGVDSGEDYKTLLHWDVPMSCCMDFVKNETWCAGAYWGNGCKKAMNTFVVDSGKGLGGVTIALAIIEILGFIFALRLAWLSK